MERQIEEYKFTPIEGTRKIVINRCYGGFGLSHAAILKYACMTNLNLIMERDPGYSFDFWSYWKDERKDENYWSAYDVPREDPILVKIVEEMGRDANGQCADLKVVEIPGDVEWEIHESDGWEWIAEKHRTWS